MIAWRQSQMEFMSHIDKILWKKIKLISICTFILCLNRVLMFKKLKHYASANMFLKYGWNHIFFCNIKNMNHWYFYLKKHTFFYIKIQYEFWVKRKSKLIFVHELHISYKKGVFWETYFWELWSWVIFFFEWVSRRMCILYIEEMIFTFNELFANNSHKVVEKEIEYIKKGWWFESIHKIR